MRETTYTELHGRTSSASKGHKAFAKSPSNVTPLGYKAELSCTFKRGSNTDNVDAFS